MNATKNSPKNRWNELCYWCEEPCHNTGSDFLGTRICGTCRRLMLEAIRFTRDIMKQEHEMTKEELIDLLAKWEFTIDGSKPINKIEMEIAIHELQKTARK